MNEKEAALKIINYLRIEIETKPGDSASDVSEIEKIIQQSAAANIAAKDAEIARLKAAVNVASKAMKMLISHVRCPDCGSNKNLPYAHKYFCYYLKVDEELTAALQEAK